MCLDASAPSDWLFLAKRSENHTTANGSSLFWPYFEHVTYVGS